MNNKPRTAGELRAAAWLMAGPDFRNLNATQASQIEELIKEAYRRGRLDERDPGSLDNDGVDRRTYEDPICGLSISHRQHFYEPMKGFVLNCPGKF